MKRVLPLLLIAILLVASGCASKKMAKRGLKYEEAGMFDMAADMFYKSLVSNPKNLDAAIGLKKNGQRVLDEKYLQVHKAYFDGNDKETVYNYLDAKAYFDKVAATGVSLNESEISKDYFEEAKPRYLEVVYTEARLLLDEEKFKESELKFAEIKKIDPTYEGVDEHMKISQCEPIYRNGLSSLSAGFNRKAYYDFSNVLTNCGTYKDAKELRDDALSKALITIAIGDIANKTRVREANVLISSSVNTALNDLKNPFIKIVDIKNTQQFIDQQVKAATRGSDIQMGQILAAKAILNGSVLKFELQPGKTRTKEVKGYLKEVIAKKDEATGEVTKENRYHKITYTETTGENNVNISFQYQLSSVESGAVLVSDAINLSNSDKVHFASFKGNTKMLVPGYWELMDKDSPKDRIDDNPAAVRILQELISAKQEVKSVNTLQNELISEISNKVADKINQYNPEE